MEGWDCILFNINCSSEICDWSKRVATSDYIDKDVGSAQNPYNINLRSVVDFREMGKGHRAMETFGFMNMPSPMTKKTHLNTTISFGLMTAQSITLVLLDQWNQLVYSNVS